MEEELKENDLWGAVRRLHRQPGFLIEASEGKGLIPSPRPLLVLNGVRFELALLLLCLCKL